MMELHLLQKIDTWPKLSWVAQFNLGSERIDVSLGPMVEAAADWCVEAVWAGAFEDGDFDRTDLIFGSGIRLRDGKAIFVSSGTTTDRLWHCERGEKRYVSNSLPALMAVADISLLEDRNYWMDIRTVCKGLEHYSRSIPVVSGDVGVVYFSNLSYDGETLRVVDKPDTAQGFSCYDDYYGFLRKTAEELAANANSPARSHRITPLCSLSSGYDASAAAVISRYAGCRHTVTMRQSSSFWRGSDSGENIARYLGLNCRAYNRKGRHYPHEAAFWSASGRAFLVNWTQFEYPEPLCLFFTGCRGDAVWDYGIENIPNPFEVPSVGDMGMAEFRLIRGVFHCPVPFWGIRHVAGLRAISASDEMRKWSVKGSYNRPIARRIVEEAGVPRGAFAVRKKNTSLASFFWWPYSPDAVASFRQYLRARKLFAPPTWLVCILKSMSNAYLLLYHNVMCKLPGRWRRLTLWEFIAIKANDLLFQWGNEELKRMYAEPLASVQVDSQDVANRMTTGISDDGESCREAVQ
jgi:hypothetical protein